MQGLNARILLSRPLTELQCARILQWLNTICETIEADETSEVAGWDCWIANGYPLRIRYKGPARKLFLTLYEEENEVDADAAQEIQRNFGWRPAHAISIGAYDTAPIDHNLLGGLALVLAEQLRGLVDYRGYLISHHQVGAKVEQEQRLNKLQGRLCTINSYYQYHVSDPVFLRSWLQHPKFTMI